MDGSDDIEWCEEDNRFNRSANTVSCNGFTSPSSFTPL